MSFRSWTEDQLDGIRRADQWRQLRTFDALGPVGTQDTTTLTSFASNDYLGLSSHPIVMAAAHEAIDRWGTGATASRLVVGSRPAHADLEQALCEWKQTEAALVFPSGFAANLGVLATLGGRDCLIVSDELNHASIIDGCRLSSSPVSISRHNDVEHVDELLSSRTEARAIVVVDAVFSMDGDEAPIDELAACCERHGALLVVDEAHAVFGPSLAAAADHDGLDLVRVVTLSKALGSLGGAVCGRSNVIDLLINRARPFIFTTGLSPADAAAAAAAIGIVQSAEGDALISRLRVVTDRVQPGHPSPIVPIIVGAEADAVAASLRLRALGLLVPAIRPPTVEPGTSRLRLAMSAAHSDAMLDDLVAGLEAAGLR